MTIYSNAVDPDLVAILNAAGTMMFACELNGTVQVFNSAAERFLGWNAAEIVGRHKPELWHDRSELACCAADLSVALGRDIAANFQVFAALSADECTTRKREWTFIRKDRSQFQGELFVSTISDTSGTVRGYLGTVLDISHRVRSEMERDRLFDLSLDILCVSSNEGYFKRVNPAFSRILGWSESDLLARPFLDLVHPEDRRATQQEVDKQTAGAPTRSFENRYRCKDGSWRMLSWTSVPQPDGLMFATARDVTEMRQAEDELRKSQQDLAITLRSIGDGVIATDTRRRITWMNPVAEQLTGWPEGKAIGRSIDEVFVIVHEETRLPVLNPVDEVLATGSVHALASHTVLKALNGDECPIADSAAPILDSSGVINGVVLVFRDANTDRAFERELQQINAGLEARVILRTAALEKEQRRLRNGNLVLESIASEATLFETLELVVRFVSEEDNATRCGILLVDDDFMQLQFGAQRNLPKDFDALLLRRPREAPVNWIWKAILSGTKNVVEDFEAADIGVGSDWRSGWVEPIIAADGKVLGGFVTLREQLGAPDEEETTCVKCACGLSRIAIEHAYSLKALKSSEDRYRTLLERIPAPVFVYDRESLKYLAVSDQAVVEYGYSREEFKKLTIADIRPEEDVLALRRMLNESGTAFEHRGVWRHRKKNGSLIDAEITTYGLELEGRSACIVLAQDVTEKLRATNALRRSEALNLAILQSSLDSIVTMNEVGEIVEFNRAAELAFGYTREQAMGLFGRDLMIPTELRPESEHGLAHYLATDNEQIIAERVRTQALRKDGQPFPVELTVVPVIVDGERLFTAFLRDLTVVVQAERELHRTTELMQAIADGTTDAVFAKDLRGDYLLFNRAAAELTGRHVNDVIGKNDIFVFGNDHGRTVMENDRLVMQSNQPLLVEEELTAAGMTRSYHAMKAPLRDTDGNVVGMIGVSRDITERKRMESALRASEERYRSIVEQSPDMMFVNRNDQISFINQAGVELLRASSAEEIVGHSPMEFFHPDNHPQINQRMKSLLSEPRTVPTIEERIIALDGSVIDVDVQAASYYSDGEIEIQVVCRDVTTRKHAEQLLKRHVRHAEFSAAIGLSLSQSLLLSEMLQSCAEAMVEHLDAAFARVWIMNKKEDVLELKASAGACGTLDEVQMHVPVGQHTIGRIAEEKSSFLTDAAQDKVDIGDGRWARSKGVTSFAGYPLLIEGRCMGVVAMFARRPLDREQLDCLAMAANGMAQNIERKQAARELADLNTTLERRVAERTLELKLSEQFNRATLDALSAHVAVVNREGSIVATNAAWRKFAEENMTDYQSVSEGSNYLRVCDAAARHGDVDAGIVAEALRDVLAGRRIAWSFEYPCHSPTEQRWYICQITLGYINREPHAVMAHENVTDIKRTQEELRDAKERAVQASLAKSEFLAAMSHELRTPLNGILGMNALLLRTELDDRQRRFAEACESSGKILTQLINDVLDLSKIEAGKLELDPRQCEIEAVVYDVVDILSSAAQQKGISLTCRLLKAACVTALFDDNRLRQILINLVGNAIKFTSAGGVSIHGDCVVRTDGEMRLRVEITDTGIGIPQERKDRLFKAFSQVDSSTTRNFGGTGLGLSICHQLITLMRGTIGVESQVGVGSTFWFEIPLINASSRYVTSNSHWGALEKVRTVTVGCSEEQQSIIAEIMVNWGCNCEHADSLIEAAAIVRRLIELEFTPVVIAANWHMLEDDSDLMDYVIKLCNGCLLALANRQNAHSDDRYQALGIEFVLPEPVRPSALFDALTSLLMNKGSSIRDLLQQSTAVSKAGPSLLRGHLLVAEDNEINRLYIVELLKLLGFTCDVVESGVEVLSAIKRQQYDLVLMDCQMPEMDGYTAAREIRRLEAKEGSSRRIPILALTANALSGDRERCMDAGMDEYVKKPIDFDNLRNAMEHFFKPLPLAKPSAGRIG